MTARRCAAWDAAVAAVGVATVVLLACLAWEAGQPAGPPPPVSLLVKRPPPRGPPELFPPPTPLLDLPRVSYVSNTACGDVPLLLVLLVISHPAHAALRDAHRAHLPRQALAALGARRVFVLADGSSVAQPGYPAARRGEVAQEAAQHGDLVVADFQEHYRNLTYKHVLALRWAAAFCPSAAFLLKMDDDILVDVWALAGLLRAGPVLGEGQEVVPGGAGGGGRRLSRSGVWAAGLVQRGLLPQRGGGKWRVSRAEYPGHVYPDFLAGWAYVATRPAAAALLRAAARLPPFWIDDVHITGTAAALAGVPRYSLGRHYSLLPESAACCLQQATRTGPAPGPALALAPLCGLLVAPSEKNMTLMASWLAAAHRCHLKHACPSAPPDTCHAALPRRAVGTVIKLS